MKILYFAPLDSVHSQRWIQYFANQGNDVYVISFVDAKVELENAHIHIIKQYRNLALRIAFFLFFVLRVRKIIRQINPDIIHVHQIILLHHFIFRNIPCPIVATPWGSDILIKHRHNFFIRWNLIGFIKYCRLFICDATHLKQALIQFGASGENIRIISFGTNLNDFNPSQRDHNIKNKFKFDGEAKLVASTRQLHSIYDIQTFIKATPLVLRDCPNVRFLITGDGPEKENLIKLSKELNVLDKINFAGRISAEDMQAILASIDIYVSTSLSDGGLAASTAEAMASQVPVIISDFGENKIWVEEGVSGFLFPLKDFEKLAEKIIYVLGNPIQARLVAENGRKVIETRNNYHVEMNKVSLIYKNLLMASSAKNRVATLK